MLKEHCKFLKIDAQQVVVTYYNRELKKFHTAIHNSGKTQFGLGWLKSASKQLAKAINANNFNSSVYRHHSKYSLLMEAAKNPTGWEVRTAGVYDTMIDAVDARNLEASRLTEVGYEDLGGCITGNKRGMNPGKRVTWGN